MTVMRSSAAAWPGAAVSALKALSHVPCLRAVEAGAVVRCGRGG